MSKETPKVTFAPGCFDDFDGTQEELDELIAEIHRLAASGELVDNAVEIDLEDLEVEIEVQQEAGLAGSGSRKLQ